MHDVPSNSYFRRRNSLRWIKTIKVNKKSTPVFSGQHLLHQETFDTYLLTYQIWYRYRCCDSQYRIIV